MKIGIDVQASVGRASGLGVYTRELVQSLLGERRNGFEFSLFSKDQEGDWNTLERLLWENAELPTRVRQERIELLHVPAFSPPFLKPCRIVVTVHDLIGITFPNQLGWPSRFYWSHWLPLAIKRADAFIADSEHTKKDMVKHLGLPEKGIRVIYPSGHEDFSPHVEEGKLQEIKQRWGIREKYFLAVGTLEPRKNTGRILKAFGQFLEERKKGGAVYQLVVVGSRDFAHGKFFESLSGEGPDSRGVVWTGYLEKEELNLLYAGSEAFLFPSLYEGFGIPVLEAMASGTPVMTSHASSLPEAAGEAAYYVDPYDVDSIAKGIEMLADDEALRKELTRKGLERIQQFSWRETARKTIEVYESLL